MRSVIAILVVGVVALIAVGVILVQGPQKTDVAPSAPEANVPDASSVAATANGENILWSELMAEILLVYRVDAGRILEQQILDRIVVQEARKEGITISEDEVEAGLRKQDEQLRAQSGGAMTLQKLCEQMGQPVDQIRRELRKQLTCERLMRREGRAQGEITDEAMQEWLNQKKARASIRTSAQGLPPHLAAAVNGEEIPRAFVLGELLSRMARSSIEAILDDLITDRLLQQKLKERGLRVTDGEVESMIQTKREMIRQDPRYHRQTLESALKSQGKTIRDLENQLRRNIALVKLHEAEIPEEELHKIFEASKDLLSGKQVRASHILALTKDLKTRKPLGSKAEARARKKIEQVRKLLDAGAKFETLAKKYSDDRPTARNGGDLKFFRKRGDVVAQVADAAFQMKKGEVRSPVKSSYGYHIIKVTDTKFDRSISFSTERFKLMVQYLGQKSNRDVRQKWIEALHKEAKIEKFLEGIGRDIQPAEQEKEKKAS